MILRSCRFKCVFSRHGLTDGFKYLSSKCIIKASAQLPSLDITKTYVITLEPPQPS